MRRRGLEPPPGYPGPGPQPGNPTVICVQCVHIVQIVRPRGRYGRNGRSGCCHGCCHEHPAGGPGGRRFNSCLRDSERGVLTSPPDASWKEIANRSPRLSRMQKRGGSRSRAGGRVVLVPCERLPRRGEQSRGRAAWHQIRARRFRTGGGRHGRFQAGSSLPRRTPAGVSRAALPRAREPTTARPLSRAQTQTAAEPLLVCFCRRDRDESRWIAPRRSPVRLRLLIVVASWMLPQLAGCRPERRAQRGRRCRPRPGHRVPDPSGRRPSPPRRRQPAG
jgi:hypothetical protein